MKAARSRTPEARSPPPDPLRRAPGAAAERGRGATFNPRNRFRREGREAYDDGWSPAGDRCRRRRRAAAAQATTVTIQRARTIIARNESPDIPFTQSINPYQGCEHGCIYCYARPTHAYLDLSPGLDFETKLFAKPECRRAAARGARQARLRAATRSRSAPTPIRTSRSSASGRSRGSILEVLAEHEHPFTIITKSALVERDIDLIAPMAAKNMARVYLSITTLDRELARTLEPRAAAPQRRLQAMQRAGATPAFRSACWSRR